MKFHENFIRRGMRGEHGWSPRPVEVVRSACETEPQRPAAAIAYISTKWCNCKLNTLRHGVHAVDVSVTLTSTKSCCRCKWTTYTYSVLQKTVRHVTRPLGHDLERVGHTSHYCSCGGGGSNSM